MAVIMGLGLLFHTFGVWVRILAVEVSGLGFRVHAGQMNNSEQWLLITSNGNCMNEGTQSIIELCLVGSGLQSDFWRFTACRPSGTQRRPTKDGLQPMLNS